jgi:thioredoxin-like negative regulator of GroEL
MVKVLKYETSQYSDAAKNLKHITAVVLVFHPQCGHCIQMRPMWEQMKRQAPPSAQLVEVNGEGLSESPEMSQSEVARNTEGFPSIMRVKNGKVVESFQQERTVPNMLDFVKKSVQDKKAKMSRKIRKNKKPKKSRKSRR